MGIRRLIPRRIAATGSRMLDRMNPERREFRERRALRKEEHDRSLRVGEALVAGLGRAVRSGPFEGLELVQDTSWNGLAPYLLGSYEREIHPAIEAIIAMGPETVINVGCAEGYYAVGMALRLPNAKVLAYDIEEHAQLITRMTAQANGVSDRVVVHGLCTAGSLQAHAGPTSAVLMDCEGGEKELLDPVAAPALRSSVILVEMHDFVDPTTAVTLLSRFQTTHNMEVFDAESRDCVDYLELGILDPDDRQFAVDEKRPTEPHPMQWALMTPMALG